MSLLLDWVLAPLVQAVGGFLIDTALASFGRAVFVAPAGAFRRAAVRCGLRPLHGFALFVALWVAAIFLVMLGIAHLVAKG